MVPWRRSGDVIRWWRTDVLGWSQQRTAEQLSVGPTALSNWEHGTREISIDIDQIDLALKGDGVLAGLLWALGTPEGMRPGRIWTKVYPGDSTPVWMWVRCPETSIRLEGEWGVVALEVTLDLGPNGLFVTVGASVSESPVVVQLSADGWADFGRGELPPSIPGAEILPAVNVVRASTATGVFMDLFSADLEERLTRSEGLEHRQSRSAIASILGGFVRSRATPASSPWPPLPEGTETIDRQRFSGLRRARGLSLAQAAGQVAESTGLTVSKDTLRRFEIDQGEPHDPLLPAALDHTLGAEGHLALVELRSGRGTGVVNLPRYWHAPIWISFDGPVDSADIELHWANWQRRLQGELPLLVVSHYADPSAPLRIITHRRVRWTAGLGRPAGAVPINHGWVPVSVDAARRAVSDTRNAVLDAIRRR